jgi:hypothetical protein
MRRSQGRANSNGRPSENEKMIYSFRESKKDIEKIVEDEMLRRERHTSEPINIKTHNKHSLHENKENDKYSVPTAKASQPVSFPAQTDTIPTSME